MNAPKFKYITLSQVMSSVEDDFHKWSDAGLVDQMKYIKVIRACNEKLGLRIYQPKHTILQVTEGPEFHHGRADLPPDFYKVEMAFALHKKFVPSMLPIGPGIQQVNEAPTFDQVRRGEIINTTGCCLDEAGNCNWLIKTPLTQLQVAVTEFIPLHIVDGSHDHFTEYSPNRGHHHRRHHNEFVINVQEEYLETNFHEGIVYMSYLADMKDETGEDIIPFSPLLNPYYEWSVKVAILENMLYNTEADVASLLKDARHERNLSFQDAVNFAMGKEAREWQRYEDKRAKEFFHKYYQIFY